MSLPRGSREGREGERDPALSRPSRFWLLLLLLPGGLLIAAGIVLASLGAALVAAALSRLPATPLASVPAPELEHDAGDAKPRAVMVGTYRHEHFDPPGVLKSITTGRELRCRDCGHIYAESSDHATWCRPVWPAPPSMEAH